MASDLDYIPAEDVRPFASQVGGHTCEKGKVSSGMLKHKDGYVLKPLLKPTQARAEVEFYKGLASSPYAELIPFVPKFYGTALINIDSYSGEVLILEDIVGALEKPCIMDIKIGRQTWEPNASASKRESEDKKYLECKRDLGFCIPGFQVFDLESGKLLKFDKAYGKSLNRNTVVNAFKMFLNLSKTKNGLRVIDEYLQQLQRVLEIVSMQQTLHLYSSSILLTYDSAQLGSKSNNAAMARVHMIDFAHALTGMNHELGVDENYLDGLRGVMSVLQSLKSCS